MLPRHETASRPHRRLNAVGSLLDRRASPGRISPIGTEMARWSKSVFSALPPRATGCRTPCKGLHTPRATGCTQNTISEHERTPYSPPRGTLERKMLRLQRQRPARPKFSGKLPWLRRDWRNGKDCVNERITRKSTLAAFVQSLMADAGTEQKDPPRTEHAFRPVPRRTRRRDRARRMSGWCSGRGFMWPAGGVERAS